MRSCSSPSRSSRRTRAPFLRLAAFAFCVLPGFVSARSGLYVLEKGNPRPLTTIPHADAVADPLLALLVGVLDEDAFGSLAPVVLDSVITAAGGSKFPYEHVELLERLPAEGVGITAEVEVLLDRAIKVGVPYSILGYHPGSVRAPKRVRLREWRIPRHDIRWVDGDHSREERFSDIRLFAVQEGRVEMDVDWWLDKLLGKKLDDTHLVGFVVTRHEGRRYGVAFGYTKGGRGRSGCFDLEKDEIVFPAPKKFLHFGREMRARAEELTKAAR